MKQPKTWYLVADGAQAHIVRELVRDPETGERLDDVSFQAEHKPMRRIMSDRPGRSFASHGARRSAMEYHSNPVREQQVRFAERLVGYLEEQYAVAAFDRLVIAAEPRMLGTIRHTLPQSLKQRLIAEFDKDLTKLPAEALYSALRELNIGHAVGL